MISVFSLNNIFKELFEKIISYGLRPHKIIFQTGSRKLLGTEHPAS
jgi:hypothetical protein